MKHSSHDRLIALAVGAHPDDIEFMMAGTLLLLKQAGVDIHIWSLGSGSGGTDKLPLKQITRIRAAEVRAAARIAGATAHKSLFDDFNIYHDAQSVARVSAVIREIRPNIILTHFPQDYMEDHQNTCRLAVTAAFSRSSINHLTVPRRAITRQPVAIYHAMPHGLHDCFRQPVRADCFVNTSSVLSTKREMLACHRSQKEWLDVTQGMDAYLKEMEQTSAKMGTMSRRFRHAEAWRQRLHLGFATPDYNPLKKLLGKNYYENSSV